MFETIGRSRGTDFFRIADQLTPQERDYWNRTRHFVDDQVLPVINDYWERAEFPRDLVRRPGGLGIVGDGIDGYGCPPMSPIANGLIHLELNRGDGSLGTFLGVQAGLAMQSIAMLGSEEQRQRWLPSMAQLTTIGAFALTEPSHGSDSVALETSARREGDTWVITGEKKWIGNGTIADVVVVWARDMADARSRASSSRRALPGTTPAASTGKARSAPSGRPTSPSPNCASRKPTGCRTPTASRTPAASWPEPATRWPGRHSATPPRHTRSRSTTARNAPSSANR